MRIKEIQALRALAALLVVIYHAKLIHGGYIGVDIFYVISGYLITGLLLREMENSEHFSFTSFYLRRVKRLLPTSFIVLISTALLSWILFPPTMRHDLGKGIAAAGIYISNFLFALWQMDYQNLNAIPPVVIHYWSLAVEEQFYLFWPIFIFLLYKVGGRKFVGIGVLVTTLASFTWSYFQTLTSPIWAFYSLPTRAWELGAGALLLFIKPVKEAGRIAASIALFYIALPSLLFNDSTPFPGKAALVPVVATALAISSIGHWPTILKKISQLKIVQWLGEISYPLYLWHWPLLVIPAVYLGRGLHIYERALAVIVTIFLADITHRKIEEPLRRKRVKSIWVLALAIFATVTSLIVGLLIYSTHTDRITVPNAQSYSLSDVLKRPVVYDDGCHVNYGETQSGKCIYGDIGSSKKIVLFGDSHAAQWFPALEDLARAHNFELISLTKSACPGPAVAKVDSGAVKNADCLAWRENSYKRIAQIHPDAVIVSGMQHYELPAEYSDRGAWWREGEEKTLLKLKNLSPHLIYIVDTPQPLRDIPSCLASGASYRCNSALRSSPYTIPGFFNINPTPWLCQESCPAIVENRIAYRDTSHLSVDMSILLAGKLLSALRAAGVAI